MKACFRITLSILAIFCCTEAAFACSGMPSTEDSAQANCDFVQYWSAANLLSSEGNPYDALEMLSVQKEQGLTFPYPIMMWNPPWTALLFYPLSLLDYPSALSTWFLVNLLLLIALILFYFNNQLRLSNYLLIISSSVFLPVISSFHYAQLGIVLAWGATLLIRGLQRDSIPLLTIGFIIVSIKFHIFLIFIAAAFAILSSNRNWKALTTLFTALGVLALSTELIAPGITSEWVSAISSKHSNTISTQDWQNSSFVTTLRIFLPALKDSLNPSVVGKIILMASIILFGILLTRKKILSKNILESSLLISSIVSPYIWLYDYSILLPLQLTIVSRYLETKDPIAKNATIAFITLQITAIALGHTVLTAQHYFFWFPWVFAAIWWWHQKKVR